MAGTRRQRSFWGPRCCLFVGAVWASPLTPRPSPRRELPLALPAALGVYAAEEVAVPPSAAEDGRCAGRLAWARYGRQELVVMRGAVPYARKADGARCLAALGHDLQLVGVEDGPLPAVVYNSVAPDGRIYRVAASYLGDGGRPMRGDLPALWRWLRSHSEWREVLRISYWDEAPAERAQFDRQIVKAFRPGGARPPWTPPS